MSPQSLRWQVVLLLFLAGAWREPGTITVHLLKTGDCEQASSIQLFAAVDGTSCYTPGPTELQKICSTPGGITCVEGDTCAVACDIHDGGPSGCPLGQFDTGMSIPLPAAAAAPVTLKVTFELLDATDRRLGIGCGLVSLARSTEDVEARLETYCCPGSASN